MKTLKRQELLDTFHGQAASSSSGENSATSIPPQATTTRMSTFGSSKPLAAPTQAIGLHQHYDQYLNNLDDIIDKMTIDDFMRIWNQGAGKIEDELYLSRAHGDLRTMINCKRALQCEGTTDLSEYRFGMRCNGSYYNDAGGHN